MASRCLSSKLLYSDCTKVSAVLFLALCGFPCNELEARAMALADAVVATNFRRERWFVASLVMALLFLAFSLSSSKDVVNDLGSLYTG